MSPTRNSLRPFLVGDKVQNTKFELFSFFVIFGATLSRRFARQIFMSFLSRQDLTKLKKQKNGFLFFVLFTTRYDKSRQSQQKLQFCTLFLYSHKECTEVNPCGRYNSKYKIPNYFVDSVSISYLVVQKIKVKIHFPVFSIL